MPIFFCISGYLYERTKKNFTWNNYKNFEIKKIINLVIPYFTFYLLFVGINMLFSNSVNSPRGIDDILDIFNNPMAPYWFLYALLSIFVVIPIIEKVFKNKKYLIIITLLFLKIGSIFIKTNVYFLDTIFANAFYFYLGNFINSKELKKENETQKSIYNMLMALIYIAIAIIIYINIREINNYVFEIIKIAMAVAGIFISVNIFKMIKSSKILDTMKNYTFQIYLLHTIFAAGIRIVLMKIGIQNYIIHFIAGMLASIYIPVLIGIICNKSLYLNFFFYPTKTIEKIKNKKSYWRKKYENSNDRA